MKARKVKGLERNGLLGENARRIVAVRLDELRSFAPKAFDPSEVKALHDMRIAAKRLRYVLEITGSAFGQPAEDGAKAARRLQDMIGEIHDCDEMLPRVHAHLQQLRSQDVERLREAGRGESDLEPAAARQAPNRASYRGLEALGAFLSARRDVLFERFVSEWERLEATGFESGLLDGLSSPRPAPAARADGGAA